MSDAQIESIVEQVKNLSHLEKIQILEAVTAILKRETIDNQINKPRRSWYGMCADLGTAPSAEDIDEVRREVWKNFPREDI